MPRLLHLRRLRLWPLQLRLLVRTTIIAITTVIITGTTITTI
jgi:hypothetical protein